MSRDVARTVEFQRLLRSERRERDWKLWGPYVAERAWGTVREDYSANGDAWGYFSHDQARSRAFRWSEDGIAGVCNRFQNLCLALACWNERDPILKERLFGLTGPQGNHGEDVKEYYFYLDGTPTHSYLRMLYKYPQVEYPYHALAAVNGQRSRHEPEWELVDALRAAWEAQRYFDIFVEYAKAAEEDILCRIVAVNRGSAPAPLHLLPQMWFRNTWSWGHNPTRPQAHLLDAQSVFSEHRHLGPRWWSVRAADGTLPRFLFTENDSNMQRLFGVANAQPYVKDAFHEAIVGGNAGALNPAQRGSKVAAQFQRTLEPGEAWVLWSRFSDASSPDPFADFNALFAQRLAEADEFYGALLPADASADERLVQRQAYAGLMWSKQFYHYGVELWLEGDPAFPTPPAPRRSGRNSDWTHLYNLDVLSMPDKWEYPWFAAWDLAFHALPIAMIDPEWAKRQLVLMLREWYMHPNGQIPAYEWAFGDVNPPVHAWATWRVYQITRDLTGHADRFFLERVFHKLLLNFTWWVNRKDADGNNVFQGGFLGLDNIGVFDRSAPLPMGGHIEQADGTAWMGMYCLNMLAIALELAREDPAYEDVATKFFEHFIYIANAISHLSGEAALWHEGDGFFYDMLHLPDGSHQPLKVRSFVGLIPLYAVEVIEPEILERLPRFRKRLEWFVRYRPHLVENIASLTEPGSGERRLLAMTNKAQLRRILHKVFDPAEFLSPYGLRSLSKFHERQPYRFRLDGQSHQVSYEPAESSTGLFGGNSNWRGPIWFPVNYLLVESLRKYHAYYGDELTVALPTGTARQGTLAEAADEVAQRLIRLFTRDESGRRPVFGSEPLFQDDAQWRDYVPFYEYFHGDNGAGLGASHQTGWTALVAMLIHEQSRSQPAERDAAHPEPVGEGPTE